MTMLMGIFSGSLSLYILFASGPLTLRMFFLATTAAAIYWVGTALAPLFPGTAWYDPEFKNASRRPLGSAHSKFLSYVLCSLLVFAVVLGGQVDPEDLLTFFAADLIKDDGWTHAVDGCGHVLHLASPMPVRR
jgi:hypothetical protein